MGQFGSKVLDMTGFGNGYSPYSRQRNRQRNYRKVVTSRGRQHGHSVLDPPTRTHTHTHACTPPHTHTHT